MELRHLRYFAAVADAGNVSRAARQLRVTQPALSRQIQDLERDRYLPTYARGFIEVLGNFAKTTYPGHQLRDLTRAVPRPAMP